MGVKKPLRSKTSSLDVYVELGRIVKTVGLRGEVKVYPFTQTPQDLTRYNSLILRNESGDLKELTIEKLRVQKQFAILKFEGVDHVDQAQECVGLDAGTFEDRLPETSEGEYYIRDLIGMQVYSEEGVQIGTVSDVLETPANDIYQVATKDRELLIPALTDVILKVDPEKRIVTVRLIEGLMDL
jgi:16S rRNA processing protein RimM